MGWTHVALDETGRASIGDAARNDESQGNEEYDGRRTPGGEIPARARRAEDHPKEDD